MDQINALWVDRCLKPAPRSPPETLAAVCQLTLVSPGDSWQRLVRDRRPVCIVFDFDYPDAAGLKVLLEARRQFPHVPVVMLVEPCYESLLLWALRARVWDVLIKPVAAARLLQCFTRLRDAPAARTSGGTRNNAMPVPAVPVESRFAAARAQSRQRTGSVLGYLAEHLHEKLSVAALARRFGMSRYQFSRTFHAEHGVTFRQHLLSARLLRAADMLSRTQAPITDVALCSGFQDLSHFARQFRRHHGCSPSAFRQSLHDQSDGAPACTTSTAVRTKPRATVPPDDYVSWVLSAWNTHVEVIVQLAPAAAAKLRNGPPSDPDIAPLQRVLEELGVTLRPQHPDVDDPELTRYFVGETSDWDDDGSRAVAALTALRDVTAAYAKPPAALP